MYKPRHRDIVRSHQFQSQSSIHDIDAPPVRQIEVEQALSYEDVIITLDGDTSFKLYIPSIMATFVSRGTTYTFPLSANEFNEPKQGTLTVVPRRTLGMGIHAFPFKLASVEIPGYGRRAFGQAGFGAVLYKAEQGHLPYLRYYITGWASETRRR